MINCLHYNTKDTMHTDPDIIALVTIYDVYQNFAYHVDKYDLYNSDLILVNM
jgi:hypothetical protein